MGSDPLDAEPLPIFVRCWTSKKSQGARRRKRPRTRKDYHTVLVFDTETYTDLGQHLLFGSYRVLRKCAGTGRGDLPPTYECVEEGFVYDPDAPPGGPPGLDVLRDFVARERADVILGVPTALRVYTVREFNDRVVLPLAYQAHALIVGFNLPFDLSRLASSWGRGRPNGLSLTMWEWEGAANRFRPRVIVDPLDSRRAFMHFTVPVTPQSTGFLAALRDDSQPHRRKWPFRGYFLDLRTLSFALSDHADSLQSAATRWGILLKKGVVDYTPTITREYLQYNRTDVELTCRLLSTLLRELHWHPIGLSAHLAYSPAGIGKAYLRAMGVKPRLEAQPDFPVDVTASAMHAYFGGRAECMIRRVPVPVVYVDFLSMYPTVCTLMNLWRLMTAATVEVIDVTEELRAWLARLTTDTLFDPGQWPGLVGFATVLPDGDVLPIRAEFAEGGAPNIAVTPVTASRPLTYTIADVVASTLLTGRPPTVLHAVRLVPNGQMRKLRTVKLRGEVSCNPQSEDFFRLTIEERQRRRGTEGGGVLEKFLKTLASSTAYGVWMEAHPPREGDDEQALVHGLNGPILTRRAVDEPGEFCFPPIAACITGAARLMLALLQRSVEDCGGCHVFCDTDSMGIVATQDGGPVPCPSTAGTAEVQTLPWADVDAIVASFARLNPYAHDAVPGSILKMETENFVAGDQTQLYCYAVSAKRYVLFTLDALGRPHIQKRSEHGLGHLLPPTSAADSWVDQAWLYMLRRDKETSGPSAVWWAHIDVSTIKEPVWLDTPALSRIGITTPELLDRFSAYNAGHEPHEHVRPFNFALAAFVAPFGHPRGADPQRFHLVTPFARVSNPVELPWFDRYTGLKYPVTVGVNGPGEVQIRTMRDHLNDYMMRPEAKACGRDGGSCRRATLGQLRPRPVRVATIQYIGKESNRLDDAVAGMAHEVGDVVTSLGTDSDGWCEYIVPVLREMGVDELQRQCPDIPVASLADYMQGRSEPHPLRRHAVLAAAADHAHAVLSRAGLRSPRDPVLRCAVFLATSGEHRDRLCPCGTAAPRRGRYCSDACRQRAYRQRRA